jgi:hypothetical protein
VAAILNWETQVGNGKSTFQKGVGYEEIAIRFES